MPVTLATVKAAWTRSGEVCECLGSCGGHVGRCAERLLWNPPGCRARHRRVEEVHQQTHLGIELVHQRLNVNKGPPLKEAPFSTKSLDAYCFVKVSATGPDTSVIVFPEIVPVNVLGEGDV